MAATLTLVSVTPNALKYLYDYDGGATPVASLTDGQLLVDARTALGVSPLAAALLTASASAPLWEAAPQGEDISLLCTHRTTETGLAIVAQFTNNIRLTVSSIAAEAGSAIVEVRFNVTPN